ncbi:MAG TPA: hypothetical protein VGH19_02635 [Verrucomicrobiae bacterium]
MKTKPNDVLRARPQLKKLAEEKQRGIIEYARENSNEQTRDWLAEQNIAVTIGALVEFKLWWQLREQFRTAEVSTQTLIELLQETLPPLDDEQITIYGQKVFTLLALKQQDAGEWVRLQKLDLDRRKMSLDEEKFNQRTCELFLAWYEDKRVQEIAGAQVPQAVKVERLGVLLFGEEWGPVAPAGQCEEEGEE